MDYYKEKRMAHTDIMNLIERKEEIDINTITFKVTQKYGFGKKFVLDYLELLMEMGFVRVKGDSVFNDALIKKNLEAKKVTPEDIAAEAKAILGAKNDLSK